MLLLLKKKKKEKYKLWRSGRVYTWNGLCLKEMQGVIFLETYLRETPFFKLIF